MGHGFNAGILCLLPKKPAGVCPELGEFFDPSDTRPLCIVNAENRLLANAVRYKAEPTMANFIRKHQKGFLPGRSMLENVVDVEEAMLESSLRDLPHMAWFFDFKAAFPSIAHTYLKKVLAKLGCPHWLLCFVDCLYDNTRCSISLEGRLFEGFQQNAGIRQGCPLSPLLFILAIEPFLRKLWELPGMRTVRAYADDIAAVTSYEVVVVAALQACFEQFGEVSGMGLNFPKTVGVPLFRDNLAAVAAGLANRCPGWAGVSLSYKAKYLGFWLGPEAKEAN